MTDTLKVLGQAFPTPGSLTDLYTVPASTSVITSSLVVCNQGPQSATYLISVAIAGAEDINAQYLYYDVTLLGKETRTHVIGATLATTDVVRVYSTGTISFNLFGVEVT